MASVGVEAARMASFGAVAAPVVLSSRMALGHVSEVDREDMKAIRTLPARERE